MAFDWDGECFIPRHPMLADKHYVVGETYRLAVNEERSLNSHNHYFAAVKEGHDNLPEAMALRLPTPEHLRKFALIKAGYRDERSVVCASRAEALRFAAFVKPIDDFAVVVAQESTVTIYTAKSQSYRAMGKKIFQESKERVLDVIAEMVGVTPTELKLNAEMAA